MDRHGDGEAEGGEHDKGGVDELLFAADTFFAAGEPSDADDVDADGGGEVEVGEGPRVADGSGEAKYHVEESAEAHADGAKRGVFQDRIVKQNRHSEPGCDSQGICRTERACQRDAGQK